MTLLLECAAKEDWREGLAVAAIIFAFFAGVSLLIWAIDR